MTQLLIEITARCHIMTPTNGQHKLRPPQWKIINTPMTSMVHDTHITFRAQWRFENGSQVKKWNQQFYFVVFKIASAYAAGYIRRRVGNRRRVGE